MTTYHEGKMQTQPQQDSRFKAPSELVRWSGLIFVVGLVVALGGTRWMVLLGLALMAVGAISHFSVPENLESWAGEMKYGGFTKRGMNGSYPRGWTDAKEEAYLERMATSRQILIELPLAPQDRVYFLGKHDRVRRESIGQMAEILSEAEQVAAKHPSTESR